jgi:hypothetical protein
LILADVCAWRRYAIMSRTPDPAFARLVAEDEIVCHPWVIGELALGGLPRHRLAHLMKLESIPVAPYADTMQFIQRYRPRGIGWVDVNLLVSALAAGVTLLTTDEDLRRNAEIHGVAHVVS